MFLDVEVMMQAKVTTDFALLHGHKYMNLMTFRKNDQPVVTPVWFAQEGNLLYVITIGNAGKVKRIRNNAHVQVAPSDARGNALGAAQDGVARVLLPDEARRANAALNRKYGLAKRGFDVVLNLRRLLLRGNSSADRVYLEISPATS